MKRDLTAELLREILDYDRETGVFRWKKRLSQGTKIGDIAGCINSDGYRLIGIMRKRYYGHILAWLHVHGEWPEDEIDHRDGIPGNDWIENLRQSNRSTNMQNVTRVEKSTQTGLLGAHRAKGGRYAAKIMLNGRSIHLGTFDTAQEAHGAYVEAKRKLHEGNTL